MMYSKNEIVNAIELNTLRITEFTTRDKKLTKILSLIAEYEVEYNTKICVTEDIRNEQDAVKNEIAFGKDRLSFRKKQLNLIEQLEELDGE